MEVELIFKESLKRISANKIDGKTFLDYFYKLFIESSDDIKKLFKNTDFEKQTTVLRKSISELVRFYSEKKINDHLKNLGKSHSRGYMNIHPKFYDLWQETLLKAVKEYDPQYSMKVELAWHVILAPGIAYMKYSYNHPDAF